MRTNTRRSWAKTKHNWAVQEALEQLEPRQLLTAGVFTPGVLDWHGVHMTDWNQGYWIITFTTEQPRAQADARARQVATALGVNPTSVVTSALGEFATIQTQGMITETGVSNAQRQFSFLHNVEPDYILQPDRVPNDATFAQEWPLRNTGQPADTDGNGTPGADMSLVPAWDITTGSRSVVVAVLDTGTDLTHPDLRPNLWVNPGEIAGNNVDDDNDGFADDVYGWDFANNDNNPQAPNVGEGGHGVAVEGTIGAKGNNAIGIAGVNWDVSILTCKIGDEMGQLSNSAIINALQYCVLLKRRGVNIVCSNNSYGAELDPNSVSFNDAERIAIQNFTDAGMLFVAAAGNSGLDNDGSVRSYPASYDNPYIIAVAATTNKDQLASFSCYGAVNVDLGAPGERIWTTALGGGYQYIDGTSFASPYTAGVIALMASVDPTATKETLRAQLLASVDVLPALTGKVATNGRLDAFKAVQAANTVGLHVTAFAPGSQAASVSQLDVLFSEDLDPTYFTNSDVELERANGASSFNGSQTDVDLSSATITLTGNHLSITFASQLPRDLYRLTLHNQGFRDSTGLLLNQGSDYTTDFQVVSFRGPYEPNDTINTAATLILNSGATTLDDLYIGDGVNPASDVDIFRLNVSGPTLLTVAVRSRSLPIYSTLDSYLRIFDSSGAEIAHNDNFDGLDSKLQIFVPGAGDYYIGISAFPNTSYNPTSGAGLLPSGSAGVYDLDVSAVTSGPQVVTQTGSGTPIPIPSQGQITSTINVTDGRSITDLTIDLNITHSFISDLIITLTGPDGTTVTLFNRRGGSGQNMVNTVFSDSAGNPISSGIAPFTGTFNPETPLTPFKNRTALGTWTLTIQDVKPLDSGTLNSWSITFTHVNDISGPFELNDTSLLATQTDIDGTGAQTFNAFIGDGAFGLRDVDLFQFTAGSGTTITAAVDVTSGSLKTVLRLFDSQGNEVRADRRRGVTSNLITFVVPNAGVYYIGVSGGTNSSNPSDSGNDNYTIDTGGSGNPTDATGDYSLTLSVEGGISEGPVVLTGNHLSVGVNSNGAIGIPQGPSTKGLSLDGLDFLLNSGMLSSYFGATFDGFVIRNTGDRSETDVPMSVSNESDYANQRVVASGVYRGLNIQRTLSFGLNDQYIAIDVSLSNLSGIVMNNIAWLEGLGARQGLNLPVVDPLTQDMTLNNVQNGTLRLATSVFSYGGHTYTIGLGAAAGVYNVVTSFDDPGVARDPIAVLSDPMDPDSSMADVGTLGLKDMSVAFNLGSIGPNQTVSFRYFLFLGSTTTQVTTAFTQLDMGTGTGHLVANPRDPSIAPTTLPYSIYYPEGFANNRDSTFLPIVNSGSQPVRVVVIAHYEASPTFSLPVSEILYDSATDEPTGTLAPHSRGGITLTTPELYADGTDASGGLPGRVMSLIAGRLGVFKDTPYAIEVRSSAPVGAEMSHYDFGITTGQAAVSTQSTTWTFAQVQKGANINDFLVFLNPSSVSVKVTLTFYGAAGEIASTFTQNVDPGRRSGWAVASLPIPDGSFAASLVAEQPIVAALTHFDSNASNGYGAIGLPSMGSLSGGTAQGQVGLTAENENIRALNANSTPTTITFTFAFANASAYRRTLVVPAFSSAGFSVSSLAGFPSGQAYGVTYTATAPVTVSLPSNTSAGSSGATLVANASTQWLFGDGFHPSTGNLVQEYLRVYNPSQDDQTVEIDLDYNDGTTEAFRRTVPARATENYNIFDFITGVHASPGTVPGTGSFYGVRVLAAVPIIAFVGHYDGNLGGGFGSMGTSLGTLASPA